MNHFYIAGTDIFNAPKYSNSIQQQEENSFCGQSDAARNFH